jgi:hypothetical protein
MSKIHVSYNQIHTMVKETVDSMHLNEDFQPDIMGKRIPPLSTARHSLTI